MTEVTETKEVAQVLRGPHGEILAAGGEEIARYYERQKVQKRSEVAGLPRRSYAERLAVEASPAAARTAQEEAGDES